MDLKELRRQRRSRFMGSMLPYVGYVIKSGVAMLLLLLLIVFSAWYTSLLRDTRQGFRSAGLCWSCCCLRQCTAASGRICRVRILYFASAGTPDEGIFCP